MKVLYTVLEFLRKLIFRLSLLLLGIFCFALTIGQTTPIEFKDRKVKDDFYAVLFMGFPVCVLTTAFGTIKRKHSAARKLITIFYTVSVAIISFFVMMNMIFTVGFAEWSDTKILYRKRDNHNMVIREQLHGWGVFGEGGTRVVRMQSYLWCWNKVISIDTTKIKSKDWIRVDESPY